MTTPNLTPKQIQAAIKLYQAHQRRYSSTSEVLSVRPWVYVSDIGSRYLFRALIQKGLIVDAQLDEQKGNWCLTEEAVRYIQKEMENV